MYKRQLIHELQKERGLVATRRPGDSRGELERQQAATDAKTVPVLDALKASTIKEQDKNGTASAVSDLKSVRARADGAASVEIVAGYDGLIASLLETESAIGNAKTTRGFGKALTTVIILEIAKENAGKLRAAVSAILEADKPINDDAFMDIITLKANIDTNLSSKALVLGSDAKRMLEASKKSSSWKNVNTSLGVILSNAKEGGFDAVSYTHL